MQIITPLGWAIGIVLAVVLTLASVVFMIWSRASWPRERRRRERWSRHLARVESWTRVTEKGDHLLVIAVPAPDARSYRVDAEPTRLRGVARLPREAVSRMENARELPVLVSPESQVVVDLRAIMGESAEVIERALYLEVGTPNWKTISSS
jgi:hypothetical protein